MELLTELFLNQEYLQLQSYELDQTRIGVMSVQASTPCPICEQNAQQIHSDYERTLADLPLAVQEVTTSL